MKKPKTKLLQKTNISSVVSTAFIILFVGLALFLTVLVNTDLTSQKLTTQSRAAEQCSTIDCISLSESDCSSTYCEWFYYADNPNYQGRCNARPAYRKNNNNETAYYNCRNDDPLPPQNWSGTCNVAGQSCCSEGDANYCNQDANGNQLSCEGNICVAPQSSGGGGGGAGDGIGQACRFSSGTEGTCQYLSNCGTRYESVNCPGVSKCCANSSGGGGSQPPTTGGGGGSQPPAGGSSGGGACAAKGGTCMNPNSCDGTVLHNLCPGGQDNKCCVPGGGSQQPPASQPQQSGEPNPRELGDSLACHDLVPQRGHNHPCVGHLQNDLNDIYGYKIPVNSIFGQTTENAVKDFQEKKGLNQSGKADRATWEKIHPDLGGGQQGPQESSSCKALPQVPDLAFNDVLPGKTSAIDWPAVAGAVKYQIRLDDPANPWSGKCGSPEPGDICDDNVTAESPKTTYTFSPGFKFREKKYRFWYSAVNSCGAVSKAGEGFITVKQGDTTPETSPTPKTSPTPQVNTSPTPPATGTSPTPKITPSDPIKFIPVPGGIPPLCSDGSKEPDLILPKTIDAGTYMIQFAQAPVAGSSYGLIIDDLSDGVLTDCKKAAGEDKCVDVTKSEYGPVTFAKGKTYRISYFEKKACGRTSNIAQYELKVQ